MLSRPLIFAKWINRIITKHGEKKSSEFVTRALFDPVYADLITGRAAKELSEEAVDRLVADKIRELSRPLDIASGIAGTMAAGTEGLQQ